MEELFGSLGDLSVELHPSFAGCAHMSVYEVMAGLQQADGQDKCLMEEGQCRHCNHTSYTRVSLRRHEEGCTKNPEMVMLVCPIVGCANEYSQKSALNLHIRNKHGVGSSKQKN